MKFGVRQICNVVFKAKTPQKIGNYTFQKMQPVLYIDSAKTSTIESSATTVYATGGRGNTRLVTWEGEKTLTYTVEDALLSPISFAMLSGAGVIKGLDDDDSNMIRFHQTTRAVIEKIQYQVSSSTKNELIIDLTDALETTELIDGTAPIFIAKIDSHNDMSGLVLEGSTTSGAAVGPEDITTSTSPAVTYKAGKFLDLGAVVAADSNFGEGTIVIVDYYVKKLARTVTELQVDAENFGGYYYVEADTLFRRESDGKDLPVNITIPKVKIQSNFTFSMASSGDPSTFTFTMDAMPDYTYFDKTKKVLCAMQIVDDIAGTGKDLKTVFSASTTSETLNEYDSRATSE